MMLAVLLLAAAATAAPPTPKLVVNDAYFPDSLSVYTGSHDIVDIVVPLNDLNNLFQDTHHDELSEQHLDYFFFVEADVKNDVKEYKGVYVYKNGKAKKLLDNGQSVTYGGGHNVYIGASDGIYMYNYVDDTVQKFGTVSASIIKMATDSFHESIYYLTSDYAMYKFKDNETEFTKFDAVKDVKDFVFDYDGHFFYYDSSKQFYLYKDNQVSKIEGLPTNPSKVYLLKAPLLLTDLYVVIDGHLYEINKNAKSENTHIEFTTLPTAFAPEPFLIQYFAHNKKIYEYNLIALIKSGAIDNLKNFFSEYEDEIKVISASKPTKHM